MTDIPRPILSAHGEDVDLEVPRLLTIRATFLSEGLFDERSGGDPEEEDLYEVEVTGYRDELAEPILFPRLVPASTAFAEWETPDEEAGPQELPMERFVLALAWELARAHPSNWHRVCEAARAWDFWMIEDALARIPPEWTPLPLIPDED